MENTRPTQHIDLILKDGAPISGTIKTPTMKLKRLVKEREVKSIAIQEECLEYFKLTKPLAEKMAASLSTPDYDALAAERKKVLDRVNALNKEQLDLTVETAKLIVNIPNDGDRKRGIDDVDWEEIPEADLNEAVRFFSNGPKS